jgi:hypothetical protein
MFRQRKWAFEHLAFVIDGPPKIVPLAVDLHENLVKLPPPPARPHPRNPTLADLGCKQRSKSVPPEPDGLIAWVDPSLVKKVLDVPQRKQKLDIHHHGKQDDLGAGAKVPEGAAFGHPQNTRQPTRLLKTHPSDGAKRPGWFAQGICSDRAAVRTDLATLRMWRHADHQQPPVRRMDLTFSTERLTGALLDRLTQHVSILEMNGDSYRLGQSRARKAPTST